MHQRQSRGFTLIELIMVIVISSVLAVGVVQFIVNSMQGVVDTAGRQQAAIAGSLAAERISREVRLALPNSVRVFGATNNCVEFVPVLAASRYLQDVAALSTTTWDVISPGAITGFVAVYPIAESVVYPNGASTAITPATVAFAGGNMETVNLGGQTFPSDSPQRRFFVVGQPVSFCGDPSGFIYRYSGYGFDAVAGSSIASGTKQTFVNGVNSLMFSYAPSTLTRNGVLTFRLVFANAAGEQMLLNQQVQVRNVP
jgi:MSHA biogenesis protein MshO